MNHPILHNNKKFYQMLNEMFSPEWLENTARDVGLIKRERKIDPVTLFWVLVLGFGVGFQRTLASLRRAYQTASAKKLAPSAFYDRFTPQLAAFFRECLAHGIADLTGQTSLALSEKLQGFKDIIVSDGTVIRLHEQLASQFPGTRGKAELKIHAAVGITGNTKSVSIYSGNTADVKTMRIGPWVKDNLLLFDLGYFKYEMFKRISENDGYFVSRMKASANPTIVSVLRTHRGNTIDLAGKKLKDVLPCLKREVIDVEIEVSFKDASKKNGEDNFEVYQPRGASKSKEYFRLVGVLDEDSQTYHLYLTNLSPDQLSAEDVALLYQARWSIELIFKELKSLYQLDVISSGAHDVVETLVLVAMLTLVVSHKILNFVRSCASPEERLRYTSLRWAELFYSTAFILLSGVLDLAGVKEDPFLLLCYYMEEGIDPNVTRERLLAPWISKENSQVLNGTN